MLRLLLWQKFLVQRNELLRGTWRKRIGWLVGMALGALFIYLVFTIGVALFEFLRFSQPDSIGGLLAAGFTVLSTFALFWGVGTVLSDLYLASDLELLLAAPVPLRDIFWLKLLSAMYQAAVPALLPITMLVAYGVAVEAGPSFFVAAAAVLLLLLALLGAVSMAIVMLLMRLMPARRAREIYSLLYVIFFAAMWLGWMLLSGSAGRTSQVLRLGSEVASAGSRLALPPASWAANLMLALARGDRAAALLNASLLAVMAVGLVGLTYWLFDRSFHRDWAAMHEVAARAPVRTGGLRSAEGTGATRGPGTALGQRLAGWLPWPARELAGKDWTIFPRDLRQLSRLVMPVVVSLFYIYQVGFADSLPRSLPGAGFWIALLVLPIVPLFFALALATPAIGKEGENFELLRVAPISGAALLWGKVWMATVPTALVAMIVTAVVALNLHVGPTEILLLLFLVCLLSAAISAAGVALGALVPNFRTVDYRRAAGPLATYGTLFAGAAIWFVLVCTIATVAIRLPANQALAFGLRRSLGRGSPVIWLLESPAGLLAVLGVDLLAFLGFYLLWRYAARRIAAWQPGE